ncbi:MAG TPA: carboxy terminal-processing peptidase [Chryseosolibacter sp.]
MRDVQKRPGKSDFQRHGLRSACLVLILIWPGLTASAQQQKRNIRQEINWLRKSLLENHVEPKVIDDKFSADLFDKLLDDLDPDKIFFTSAEVTSLQGFRSLLDDEVNGKNTGFLDQLQARYKYGLQRSRKLIDGLLSSPLDWNKKEMFDPVAGWSGDEHKLEERHRQWLKSQILARLGEMMDRDSVTEEGFFQKHLSAAVDYVRLSSLRPIARLLKDPYVYGNEMTDTFLQTFAGIFDPHSTFFSTRQYDDFVAALSTEDYHFGFTLDENGKGQVVISALAPGGAAWKSGMLHASDRLLAIKWPGEERIDVSAMNLDDVIEMFATADDSNLEMTVRSVDGTEKQVVLQKEKLEQDENIVESFVLRGEITAGYIYLPDFYTRWDDGQEGGRCANDVAKEIIRLKKEGIEGLILDLRFNGGGSLYEAQAMAGIFIDEGPLAMMRTRDKKVVTVKDMNRGTIYDGPLVIMVNGNSASASEVLAASIQDYNRGLIVGSQTYGKATGQNLLPLDQPTPPSQPKTNMESKTGYVKVTTERLYRVTGKSAQGKGVSPDVVMPDIFDALDLHEAQYPFALKADSISANAYFKPLKPIDKKELQAKSRERLKTSAPFNELQQTLSWIDERLKKTNEPQPLSWEAYLADRKELLKYDISTGVKVESPEKIYEVSNGASKETRLMVDDYARDLNVRWLKILSEDIYLQETYQVLRDQILLTKNP